VNRTPPGTPKKRGGPIDWAELHRRLDAAARALAARAGERRAPEILRERARLAAGKPAGTAPEGGLLMVVEFTLGRERYAVDASDVVEVARLRELRRIPDLPEFVPGVINVRGRVVSVLDIGKFYGLPEKGLTDTHRAIVVRAKSIESAILADTVPGVREIPTAEVLPAPGTHGGIRADYLKGVTKDSMAILDVHRMLLDPRVSPGAGE
jgi:purine-binding chemotaxis protein CheW